MDGVLISFFFFVCRLLSLIFFSKYQLTLRTNGWMQRGSEKKSITFFALRSLSHTLTCLSLSSAHNAIFPDGE
ncbi:hypothetical protein BDF21DRAFT_407874 [Thamnidium elegans]|nr:hypothetical protein BDF21DRAFT_407874 [Thamnidium elegans]